MKKSTGYTLVKNNLKEDGQMKISVGYTLVKDERKQLERAGVDAVIFKQPSSNDLQEFYHFVENNPQNDIVLVSIYSISPASTLHQLSDSINWLRESKQTVRFLNKGLENSISDNEYIDILWHLVTHEKRSKSIQAKAALQRARENGSVLGRPQLSKAVIEKIIYLSKHQKKSMREIAKLCNVSVGSVHKYIKSNA